jgi:hypothetical protein
MSVVLTLMVLAVASATLVLALRRRQSQFVPAYVPRPENAAAPRPKAPRRPRGCNW